MQTCSFNVGASGHTLYFMFNNMAIYFVISHYGSLCIMLEMFCLTWFESGDFTTIKISNYDYFWPLYVNLIFYELDFPFLSRIDVDFLKCYS